MVQFASYMGALDQRRRGVRRTVVGARGEMAVGGILYLLARKSYRTNGGLVFPSRDSANREAALGSRDNNITFVTPKP